MIEVQQIAAMLQPKMQWLKEYAFQVDNKIALIANSVTRRAYEKSTIAYKFYDKINLPSN